jgi:hypothetical protein
VRDVDQPSIVMPGHDPVHQALALRPWISKGVAGAGHLPPNVDRRHVEADQTDARFRDSERAVAEDGLENRRMQSFDPSASLDHHAEDVGELRVFGEESSKRLRIVAIPGRGQFGGQGLDCVLRRVIDHGLFP